MHFDMKLVKMQTSTRERDKFEADVSPLLASLPSFTALGMASLLPGGNLGISDPARPSVTLDEMSTAGIENRKKVLDKLTGNDRSDAWQAKEFLNFKSEQTRHIIRDNDIIYIYVIGLMP